MSLNNMKDLLVQQLNELYAAEKDSLRVLAALERAAASPELGRAFSTQITQTEQHLCRLDEVFCELGIEPKRAESKGMKGLLEDCIRFATQSGTEAHVRDAALIAAAQHLKHDEIAGYGCAKAWASLIGSPHVASELGSTLREEHATDATLTKIAETINQEALAPVSH